MSLLQLRARVQRGHFGDGVETDLNLAVQTQQVGRRVQQPLQKNIAPCRSPDKTRASKLTTVTITTKV